jgi:hypothetical protein
MAKPIVNPVPTSDDTLRRVAEDIDTLRLVFGWLSSIFGAVEDATKKDKVTSEAKFSRIRDLAACGIYLARDWEGTAESMVEGLLDELKAEAGHGN